MDPTKIWDLDRKNLAGKRISIEKGGAERELDPAKNMLYLVLSHAIQQGATDVHVEAEARRLRIRYRIDGDLIEQNQVPSLQRRAFIAAVKVNSTIDVGSPMHFESGRAGVKTGGKVYDLRIEKNASVQGQELRARRRRLHSLCPIRASQQHS